VKLLNKYNPKFQINETKDKLEYPFEFIVIDEAQDLTQIQIYSLYHLVEDKAKIVFAGDEHQIINPTMFTIKDINALFSSDSEKPLLLDRKYIIHNFRSQKNIVDLANHMSRIRRRHIAKSDDETEQNIESVTDNGVKPFYLSYSDKNASEIIRSLKQYPDTAIIVADENIKNELTTRYGEGQIFTVLDIKGLEFKYVLCYGLLGEYRQIWEEIFDSGQAKNNSRYRYYFNVFYVAITRAKEYLCLIDDKPLCQNLENEIIPYVNIMEDFDFDSLCISALINTSEAWYESANRLEQAEHYDEAILQYKKSNETSETRNTEKAIKRHGSFRLR
jgi:superfamily I DNA/RNA helicase